ncbi:minor capsid protein [Caproiciproducens sp. CPB-2]|uniref:minor capsid protein n=1 Tax=Caproiciproducens sp. CPB-2 TaxID=3030017 RepID=UPI0023DBA9F7|nr:minor capsid protein [Caproiciproducens sp. CPB-2]MDF1496332.1 minor capsid protein [Caproiciproducens sp. CPB-2]
MNNKFKNDILQIEKDCINKAKKPKQELLRAYKKALDDIQNEIAGIVQRYEVDGVINISSKQRYSELMSLKDKLVKQANNLGSFNVKQTSDLLPDIYSESYYRTAYVIDKGITANIDFSILRPEMIEAAINTPIDKMTFSDRIWNNQKALTNRIYNDVRKALVSGKSPEKLARQIKKDYGVTAYQASRLINTETARAMSMAQDQIYNDSDVVQRVMWDATLEGNTCEVCASLDGQYFPKDNHPDNPRHPMCRCCIIPVIEGWKPTRKLENIENPETGKKTITNYSTFDKWKDSKGI